jgi:hypothetical protein
MFVNECSLEVTEFFAMEMKKKRARGGRAFYSESLY